MKTLSWIFFGIYSLGLIISVMPLIAISAILAVLGVTYIGLAQFWVIWTNRDTFRGFFRSSIFHLIPVAVLTYVIGSQMTYFLISDAADAKGQHLALSLVSLFLPFIMIWAQYALFRKAYSPSGIMSDKGH